MKSVKTFDIIILGGGIAGMTAAIYTARANLNTVIIDTMVCGGLVNSTYVVENFPSYNSIHGMDLMDKVHEQVLNLGVEVDQMAEITAIDITAESKVVETEELVYTGKAMVLATGRVPIKLDIDTDCEDIHYCSVCDGSHYKGKKVLVVGGGNSGFDEALFLLSLGVEHITLIEIVDRFFATQTAQNKLFAHKDKIVAKTATSVRDLICDSSGKLEGVILENTGSGDIEQIDVDGIFVYMGQYPNTPMFADVIKLDNEGYIITNEKMETNVSGVFAAGDVVQKEHRQITTAMADGTIAALTAIKYFHS